MSKGLSIKKNFVMNMILTLSQFIFPLITFQYASRILLPEGMGKVSFAISFVAYFLLLSRLGIPTYGVRTCAAVRDDKEELSRTVQELLGMNLAFAALSYALLFGLVWCIPRLRDEKTLYIVVSAQILFDAIGIEWLYKALEQYTYITVRSIAFKLLSVIALLTLVHAQDDYVIYAGVTIFAASASNLFNFLHAHRYIQMRPVGNYHFKRHFKAVLIFLAMAGATTIYTHMDSVMLGLMSTDHQVGLYSAAIRIRSILVSIVTSLGVVLLPRASYYVHNGLKDEFLRISKKALNFVWILALPLTVYIVFFAKLGIYFLSGESFEGAVLPLQVIMPTVLLVGITNIMGIQMLVPLGKERIVLWSEVCGAITDLALNALLIPRYAATGAAMGTLAAEAVVFLVQLGALKSFAAEAFSEIQYWKLGLGLLAGLSASLWLRNFMESGFGALLGSAALFFLAYGAVLLILKEKLTHEVARQALQRICLHKHN